MNIYEKKFSNKLWKQAPDNDFGGGALLTALSDYR